MTRKKRISCLSRDLRTELKISYIESKKVAKVIIQMYDKRESYDSIIKTLVEKFDFLGRGIREYIDGDYRNVLGQTEIVTKHGTFELTQIYKYEFGYPYFYEWRKNHAR